MIQNLQQKGKNTNFQTNLSHPCDVFGHFWHTPPYRHPESYRYNNRQEVLGDIERIGDNEMLSAPHAGVQEKPHRH